MVEHKLPKLDTGVRFPSPALQDIHQGCFPTPEAAFFCERSESNVFYRQAGSDELEDLKSVSVGDAVQ